jgi:transcriptional regulator with AAA-type ATPase domain
VATGTTNADISRRLHVSLATVKSHLFNAYRKLGVANRVEATRIYLEQHDDQAPHRPLLDRTATTTLGSATPDLLPHEIDRHLEVLAGVSAETERLRRRLEALRSARTGHDKRS